MNANIFVQLAAYRDPETIETLRDLFDKARYPERVYVGLCWQYLPGIDEHVLFPTELAKNIRAVTVPIEQSEGLCWARYVAQGLYRGEDYVLSVTSRCRFVQDWDSKLIAELARCNNPKAILTHYPSVDRGIECNYVSSHSTVITAQDLKNGVLRFRSLSLAVKPDKPLQGLFGTYQFCFAHGSMIGEVPNDPRLHSSMEDFVFSLKLWTHGYDCYSPSKHFVFLLSTNTDEPFHRNMGFEDEARFKEPGLSNHQRLDALLWGGEVSFEERYPLSAFLLGNARGLDSFYAKSALTIFEGKLAFSSSKAVTTAIFGNDLEFLNQDIANV